jgi:lysophospholipase L1-like esterase
VQTNSFGLRNIEEPNEKAFRILALGDSQTFGPYLANEDTWPAWTENALRRSVTSKDGIQVFNGGISGYTILDELALLKEKGGVLRPDLALIAVFDNDLSDLLKERNGRVQRPLPKGPWGGLSTKARHILESFALYNVARDLWRRAELAKAGVDIRRGEANAVAPPTSGTPGSDERRLKKRYLELFSETVALTRARGMALAVIYIPAAHHIADGSAHSSMEAVIAEATARHKVPFLSLTETFKAVADAPTRLYLLQRIPVTGELTGNAHLSREGNAAIGTAVAQWVLGAGLYTKR